MVEIEEEPRHHLVLVNDFVRVFAVEIAPHDRTLCHHHPNDYLLYVASGAEIVSAARDEEPKRLSYRDGECELAPAGLIHTVENLGNTPFRNVVVELLPRAAGLGRGAEPKSITGEVTIRGEFSQQRAAIFVIAMESDAEVEISGPAVVATPYDDALNPEEPEDIIVKPNSISDVAWIPSGGRALLWGCKKDSERAVVFQIGSTDNELQAAPKVGEPLKSLRTHADEPE